MILFRKVDISKRVRILDALRGAAVLAMIVHHGYVLLNFMRGIEIGFFSSDYFPYIQMFFVGIFLLVSGICTNYSRSVAKRGVIVFAAAILVTLVTAVLLPLCGIGGLEIYFGILHMFGLSMLLYALLRPLLAKCPAAPVAVICFLLFIGWQIWMHFIPTMESPFGVMMLFGFPRESFYSADYYPLLPYFFLFVCGAMIGRPVKAGRFPKWFYDFHFAPLEFVGRHSLLIYLLHQPVILLIILLVFR